jgi:hypothetical protein
MFEQAQIQEFKEAFTIMDQNRDGFIDKNDLRDTFCALGELRLMLIPLENGHLQYKIGGEVIFLGQEVTLSLSSRYLR